jgi:hypothetical protein
MAWGHPYNFGVPSLIQLKMPIDESNTLLSIKSEPYNDVSLEVIRKKELMRLDIAV